MLNAGKLRHRIEIQKPVDTQDTSTGAVVRSWETLAVVWAAIEPLSVKEFIAAQTEDSKVSARISVRYRSDISHEMRIFHAAKDKYYNIEGILSDKNSGLEYLTIPVSEGVRYQQFESAVPVILVNPLISGTPDVGLILTGSIGSWANNPVSYVYQWYLDDTVIVGEEGLNLTVPDEVDGILTFGVTAINSAGESDEAFSNGVVISE